MKRICIPINMRAATRIKSAGGGNNCGIGEDGDAEYTLTTLKSFVPGVFYMECYENHPNDSKVNGPYQICPTLSKRMGTQGGGILPW